MDEAGSESQEWPYGLSYGRAPREIRHSGWDDASRPVTLAIWNAGDG